MPRNGAELLLPALTLCLATSITYATMRWSSGSSPSCNPIRPDGRNGCWNGHRNRSYDLANLDLSGTDLSGINLKHANLKGADLRRTTLVRANPSQASLRTIRSDERGLGGATLSGSNLNDANLRGAQVGGASFVSADLEAADLGEAGVADFEFESLAVTTKFDTARLSRTVWLDGSTCPHGVIEKCK